MMQLVTIKTRYTPSFLRMVRIHFSQNRVHRLDKNGHCPDKDNDFEKRPDAGPAARA